MDPGYIKNWLHQQNVSMHSPHGDMSQRLISHSNGRTPVMSPSSSLQVSPAVEEPLDLRVKVPEPVDNSAPLDLTVTRPTSAEISIGYPRQVEKTSSRRSSMSLATKIPSPFQQCSPRIVPYVQHRPRPMPYISDKKLHCIYCGYQCDPHMKEGFDHHLAAHASRSFQLFCFHCQKPFGDQSALHEHLPTHNSLFQYICTRCCVAFSNQPSYRAHVFEKHGSSSLKPDKISPPQRVPEHTLLKISSASASLTDRSQNSMTPFSNDTRSPLSNNGASSSISPAMSASTKSTASSKQPTFGQSLAKHIEAAISQQVSGTGKPPSLSDVMFMKINTEKEEPATKPPPTPTSQKNPLNLLSLMGKVVEESIRATAKGKPAEKPDLRFTVTFSDEDEKEVKECDSTVANGLASADSANAKSTVGPAAEKAASSENAEDMITSTERPVESPSAINSCDLTPKDEKRPQI